MHLLKRLLVSTLVVLTPVAPFCPYTIEGKAESTELTEPPNISAVVDSVVLVTQYTLTTPQPEVFIAPPSKRIKLPPSPAMQSDSGVTIIGNSLLQCVLYAKKVTGINKSIGYAGNAPPDGYIPLVGSIGLLKNWGHAVAIESIDGDMITITEANWVKGKIDRRVLKTSDFRGYIYSG